MERFYISDLDGTLAIESMELTPRTAATLLYVLHGGMPLTFATGRGLRATVPEVNRLGIDLPLVLYNGAFIYDVAACRPIKMFSIPPQTVEAIVERMEHYGVKGRLCLYQEECEQVQVYSSDPSWYSGRSMVFKPDGTPYETFHVVDNPHAFSKDGAVVFMSKFDRYEVLKDLVDDLRQIEDLSVIFHPNHKNPEIWYLDILSGQASKGRATRFLKEYLDAQTCIAFGDSDNDASMLRFADRSYAVASATPLAKENAKVVLADRGPDSVALFLEKEYIRVYGTDPRDPAPLKIEKI